MRREDRPLFTVLASLMFALFLNAWYLSDQQPQNAVGVQSQQQANGTRHAEGQSDQQYGQKQDPLLVHEQNSSIGAEAPRDDNRESRAYEQSEYWVILGRRFKITDFWLMIFTGLLVVVGVIQSMLLRTTVRDTGVAARAAEKAANAAIAALDRPWLVIENIKYNWHEWTAAEEPLTAQFRVRNYGKVPAFIIMMKAILFQSPPDGFPVSLLPRGIMKFPDKTALHNFINEFAGDPFMETAASRDRTVTNSPVSSRLLERFKFESHIALPPDRHSEMFFFRGHRKLETLVGAMNIATTTDTYLLGWMIYELPGQDAEVIRFCYRGNGQDGFSMAYGAPYNERTKAL